MTFAHFGLSHLLYLVGSSNFSTSNPFPSSVDVKLCEKTSKIVGNLEDPGKYQVLLIDVPLFI